MRRLTGNRRAQTGSIQRLSGRNGESTRQPVSLSKDESKQGSQSSMAHRTARGKSSTATSKVIIISCHGAQQVRASALRRDDRHAENRPATCNISTHDANYAKRKTAGNAHRENVGARGQQYRS